MNWITDKEPTENGVYLTTLKVEGDVYVVLSAYNDKGWVIGTGSIVVAWMDLPKPYQE